MKDRMGSELTPSLLKKLLGQGKTYTEIAEHFGRSYDAIKSMANREGLTKPRRPFPLDVKSEHKRDPETGSAPYQYRMLNIRAAMLAGEDVSEAQIERYEGWMEMLREEDEDGDMSVVFYKPDGRRAGWHYVKGNPDAGEWPIHELCLARERQAA